MNKLFYDVLKLKIISDIYCSSLKSKTLQWIYFLALRVRRRLWYPVQQIFLLSPPLIPTVIFGIKRPALVVRKTIQDSIKKAFRPWWFPMVGYLPFMRNSLNVEFIHQWISGSIWSYIQFTNWEPAIYCNKRLSSDTYPGQ